MIWLLVANFCVFLTCVFGRMMLYASGAKKEYDTTVGFGVCVVLTTLASTLYVYCNSSLPIIGKMSWWGEVLVLMFCATVVITLFVIVVSFPPHSHR
jgi:hypothetical protein